MDRARAHLSSGVESWNDLVIAVLVNGESLATVVGRDAAHVVVHSGDDRDGLPGDIHTGEDHRGLRDAWQPSLQLLWGKVVELQVDVILLRAAAPALSDLHSHGSGHDVSAGKILGHWGVPLHEPLALRVDKVATFASAALSHEAASAVDACGVELDKLHVLVGEAGPCDHGSAVTSASVSRCG